MRAIHCLSSRPMLQGRQISGTFQPEQTLWAEHQIQLPECVLYTMQASALYWRINNGRIKLYTDTPMKNYLSIHDMLDCWDEVDTETLDSFYDTCKDIDFRVFWSAGKFACYLKEKVPFVCIDTDLIVWKPLAFDKYLDFGFSHWEQIEEGDENYPHESKIAMPSAFRFDYSSDRHRFYDSRACNMSITYFGHDYFREEFAKLGLEFMCGNPAAAENRYATPEILFIEQRVPLILACKNCLNYAPVMPCTWSPKKFRLVHPTPYYKNWFFADLDTTKLFTHLWFHKKYLSENPEAHKKYCQHLYDIIPDKKAVHTRTDNDTISRETVWVSHKTDGGKKCNEIGCSRCSEFVWVREEDTDIPESVRSCATGPMKMTWCGKYSMYLGPYPPGYGIGSDRNASI